eukprot:2832167-Rhodomonas_salina.1
MRSIKISYSSFCRRSGTEQLRHTLSGLQCILGTRATNLLISKPIWAREPRNNCGIWRRLPSLCIQQLHHHFPFSMQPLGPRLLTSTPDTGNSSVKNKQSGCGTTLRQKVLTSRYARATAERAVRDLLQASSFCFPTSSVVSRNHGCTWSTKCKLCRRAVDTYTHRFMQCQELHCAGHTMHDMIAKALLHFLTASETLQNQGNIPPRVELYIGERVDAAAIWPDCPPELCNFLVVIFEFASSYTIKLTELETVTIWAAKRNQYQGLYYFLRSLYADHE